MSECFCVCAAEAWSKKKGGGGAMLKRGKIEEKTPTETRGRKKLEVDERRGKRPSGDHGGCEKAGATLRSHLLSDIQHTHTHTFVGYKSCANASKKGLTVNEQLK